MSNFHSEEVSTLFFCKLKEHSSIIDVPQITCSNSWYYWCYNILTYLLTALPPFYQLLSWFVLVLEVCSTGGLVGPWKSLIVPIPKRPSINRKKIVIQIGIGWLQVEINLYRITNHRNKLRGLDIFSSAER